MGRKKDRPLPPAMPHALECGCPLCRKKVLPAHGGRAPDALPSLADESYSRFRLHDAGREADGGLGFVSLNERFVNFLDERDERARLAWSVLQEREPEAAACFRLCAVERLSQRACADQMGMTQPTVHRRVRAAHEFLLAAVGEQLPLRTLSAVKD